MHLTSVVKLSIRATNEGASPALKPKRAAVLGVPKGICVGGDLGVPNGLDSPFFAGVCSPSELDERGRLSGIELVCGFCLASSWFADAVFARSSGFGLERSCSAVGLVVLFLDGSRRGDCGGLGGRLRFF
jgi:hypothetical protein